MTDQREIHTDPIHTELRGDDTVVASVIVQAPPAVIFPGFADPAVLAQWFWPPRFGTRVESDLRPGGAFAIHADGLPEGQDMGVTGTYQDVQAPDRLRMSWQWNGETTVSHVSIDLADVEGQRTQVVVTHRANASRTQRDDHEQGWRDCLGRLVEQYR